MWGVWWGHAHKHRALMQGKCGSGSDSAKLRSRSSSMELVMAEPNMCVQTPRHYQSLKASFCGRGRSMQKLLRQLVQASLKSLSLE